MELTKIRLKQGRQTQTAPNQNETRQAQDGADAGQNEAIEAKADATDTKPEGGQLQTVAKESKAKH